MASVNEKNQRAYLQKWRGGSQGGGAVPHRLNLRHKMGEVGWLGGVEAVPSVEGAG